MKKMFFLIRTYVPHTLTTVLNLLESYSVDIHIVSVSESYSWIPDNQKNLKTYKLKDYGKDNVLKLIKNVKPDILICAGWMTKEYNWICRKTMNMFDIPVVGMSDTPWYGTFRQNINAFIAPFHVRRLFSHIWVSGIKQYDYARRLGFSNGNIIFNSLCADNYIFNNVCIKDKQDNYPKNFLYIGRYTNVKGLYNLMRAWSSIEDKRGWTFTLIGNGDMKEQLENSEQFIVKDYMDQNLLLQEMKEAGCFVLPSLFESWALVIHEAACASLPIICTETCGASSHFVIDNFNGFKIENNSVSDLKAKIELIINTSDEELMRFGKNSRVLSESITPIIQSASIMQLLYDKQ